MKKKFAALMMVLLSATASFGQAELEKYVGQYQVTGAPIMITVTATGGKLAIAVTGQGSAEIELVSGEDYSVKGTAITLTFQKDAAGKVTGMMIHQSPGLDVPAPKINSFVICRAPDAFSPLNCPATPSRLYRYLKQVAGHLLDATLHFHFGFWISFA